MCYDSDFLPYPSALEEPISYMASNSSLIETKPISLIYFFEFHIILRNNERKFDPADTEKIEITRVSGDITRIKNKKSYGMNFSFLVDLLNKNNIVDTDVVSVYGANKESTNIVNLTCLCKQQLRNKTSNKSISRQYIH